MKKRGQRSAIIAVLLVGIIIFGVIYFAWSTVTDIFQPVSSTAPKTVSVVIQDGETTQQIAEDLQSKGLVRNALAFRVWARIKGLDTQLQAGGYKLKTNMTIDTIIGQLLNGQPDELVLHIPEGFRLEQIVQRAGQLGLLHFNKQDFLRYIKNPGTFPDAGKYPFLRSIPAGDGMEGLLFPDTYLIPVNATARDVVNMMLGEFNNVVQKNHLDTIAQRHKLTLYQTVILASIVEREAVFDVDRPKVASVYWDRIYLPNDETVSLLDADPTVQYARDSQGNTTTYWAPLNDAGKNIAPDSLWNTYTHKGFPPTPICSPGLASMQAATAPPNTGYYFFLSKKDGHNVYAHTAQEFAQEQQQYLH